MGLRLGEKVNRARDWVGAGDRANEAEAVCPPQEKTGRRPADSRRDQQRAVYGGDCQSGSRSSIESSPPITIFLMIRLQVNAKCLTLMRGVKEREQDRSAQQQMLNDLEEREATLKLDHKKSIGDDEVGTVHKSENI